MPPTTYKSPLKASLSLDLNSVSGHCTIHPENSIELPLSPSFDSSNSTLNKILSNFIKKEMLATSTNTIDMLDLASNNVTATMESMIEKSNSLLLKKEKRSLSPFNVLTKKNSVTSKSNSRPHRLRTRTNTFHTTFSPFLFLSSGQSKRNSLINENNNELCFFCSSNLPELKECSNQHNLEDQLFVQMEELDHTFVEISY
ncbi:hypothetical protein K502DRAFT_363899 [Neoconidiobolus thromboides FSU 785]|nr:hypothetical protein K502DRAFT_363899 [Neoconidiobolus thromboides FSU 785]